MRQAVKNRPRPSATDLPEEKLSAAATGSDLPLAVDTDAEAAFSNGTQWFYRRGHHHSHTQRPPSPDIGSQQDPLRSSAVRRKWVADLLHHGGQEEEYGGRPTPTSANSSSLFRRLRTNSFPNLRLSGLREHPKERQESGSGQMEQSWSSDSSSGDDVSLERDERQPYPTLYEATRSDEDTDVEL